MTESRCGRGDEGKRPITHARAKLLFSKAWDGAIRAEELAALAAHLEACPKCATATRRMQALLERLEKLFDS